MGWGAARMPGKTARPTQSFLVRKRVAHPRAVAAYAASIWRPVQDGRGGKPFLSVLVDCRQLQVHARAARFNDRARRLAAQDAMAPITRAYALAPEALSASARPKSRVELSFSAGVLVAVKIEEEATMGRGLLLWLIGIPIPIILLIWLFGGLHG